MVLTNQLINVKTMRKIFSNYMCFSKSPNFTRLVHQRWNQMNPTEIVPDWAVHVLPFLISSNLLVLSNLAFIHTFVYIYMHSTIE